MCGISPGDGTNLCATGQRNRFYNRIAAVTDFCHDHELLSVQLIVQWVVFAHESHISRFAQSLSEIVDHHLVRWLILASPKHFCRRFINTHAHEAVPIHVRQSGI